LPAYSVQYHPEASPGPKDSHYLFEEFFGQIEKHASGTSARPSAVDTDAAPYKPAAR
ncbi:MAG: hypothetical protein ABIY63_08810, partial [Fibrobacteria bacterium]